MADKIDIPGIPNLLHPEPRGLSGGQPGPEQLDAVAKSGIGSVINLRPESEDPGFDEASKLGELGLAYTVLGIAGPEDLTADNARKLDRLLAEYSDTTTLVHCGSGNRVGALMALRAAWVQDKPRDEALEIGRQWGLTKLEGVVDQLLS